MYRSLRPRLHTSPCADRARRALVVSSLIIATALTLGASGDPATTLHITKPVETLRLPDVSLRMMDGHTFSPRVLQGRVLLLNFWATWCGPCREEMPSLNRLRQRFDPDEFEIYAVTTDIRPRSIRAFWRSLNLTMPVVFDDDETFSQALLVRHLPTTILVDPDGVVVGRAIGPRAWDSPDAVRLIESIVNHRRES